MNLLIFLGLAILALALVFTVFFKKSVIDRQIEKLNDLEDEVEKAKLKAKEIVEEAEKDASSKAKEIELKAKEKAYQIKEEVEKEARNLKNEIAQKEARIVKKEEILDGKIEKAENKSLELEKINNELEAKRKEIDELKVKQEEELSRVSELTKADAREILLHKIREELTHDMAVTIREFETKLDEEKEKISQKILSTAIGKAAADYVELSIPSMHPEIIKTLGRLKYRTSYGQNVLTHSIEVAKIASTMAAEIGANVELAKRGGLLHDIGKVLVNEIETSHAIVGGEFVKKFGEKQEVVNAVMAHHNEVEFETVEAILVQAADAVSASRPGARRETLTAYIKRLENLEEIANSFDGVESSYAIQAGRELRIVINPDKVSDDEATLMSREVAKKIEDTMQYPGQIKVTILRETRAVEYAK